jgi:hypothetical protein
MLQELALLHPCPSKRFLFPILFTLFNLQTEKKEKWEVFFQSLLIKPNRKETSVQRRLLSLLTQNTQVKEGSHGTQAFLSSPGWSGPVFQRQFRVSDPPTLPSDRSQSEIDNPF